MESSLNPEGVSLRWFVVIACLLGLVGETIGLAALVEQSHRQAMMAAAAEDGDAMSCHDDGAIAAESEGEVPAPAASFEPVHECCVTTRCPCCKRAHVAPTFRIARIAGDAAPPVIQSIDVIAYSAHSLHDVFLNTLDRPPKHA